MLNQRLLQHAPGLNEQTAIDRLVRHPERLVLGVVEPQPPGDLLRRPVALQKPRDDSPQLRVCGQLTRLGPQRPMPGLSIRGRRAVAASTTVASNLPADRGGSPTHAAGNNPQRASVHQPSGNLLPLDQRPGQPGASSRWRPNATRRTNVREDRARALAKDPADRLEPFALLPPLPNLGALGRRVMASLPS